MADVFSAKVDTSGWMALFNVLDGPLKVSLARRMGAAGGRELRDEAKRRAPVSDGPYNPDSRGSHSAGTLREAIYLAYDEKRSGSELVTYSISWNSRTAWWGKLVEFGHWRNAYYRDESGAYHGIKGKPKVVWEPAQPFLRPAFDSHGLQAARVAIATAKVEFPKLLQEQTK